MSQALRRCTASLLRAYRVPPVLLRGASPWAQTRKPLSQLLPRPITAGFHHGTPRFQEELAAKETSAPDAELPLTKFEDLGSQGILHPNLSRTLTDFMGLHTMTEVQSRTIHEALKGTDIVAKAKTGTGKTLAFLVPVLQNIIRKDPQLAMRDRARRAQPTDIRAIIISPTRELAEQIAEEARKATSRTNVVVQTAVGGTRKKEALYAMKKQGCHILVGTPGRLSDLLSDPDSGISAPQLHTLVLDEADRLLDEGFAPTLKEIKDQLPDPKEQDRQTLMFSATMAKEVLSLVRQTMKRDYVTVDCIPKDELPTHQRVPQKVVYMKGLENTLPALFELCEREIRAAISGQKPPFKAIVFFNTTAEVTMASEVFEHLRKTPSLRGARLYTIHGKLSQAQRTRAAEAFKKSTSGILFSSDVTARGMHFPNVTQVIQIGNPRNRDDYVHRIGRTGRAGKEGESWLFLNPLDKTSADRVLAEFKMEEDASLDTAKVDMTKEARISTGAAKILTQVSEACSVVPIGDKSLAYNSTLSRYGAANINKQRVVDSVNRLSQFGWGLRTPPFATTTMLKAYRGVDGLRVAPQRDNSAREHRSIEGDSRPYAARGGRRSFDHRGMGNSFDAQDGEDSFRGRRRSDSFSSRGRRSAFGDRERRSSPDARPRRRSFSRMDEF